MDKMDKYREVDYLLRDLRRCVKERVQNEVYFVKGYDEDLNYILEGAAVPDTPFCDLLEYDSRKDGQMSLHDTYQQAVSSIEERIFKFLDEKLVKNIIWKRCDIKEKDSKFYAVARFLVDVA